MLNGKYGNFMHNLIISDLSIKGLKKISKSKIHDDRGFFSKIYSKEVLLNIGFGDNILQINHTYTNYVGTIRGLHYQMQPFSETKIITCLKGEIFDVIVDLRIKSPTYLKWQSIILSEQNNDSILIPKGFAHGFQTLCNDCELLYLHDMPYRNDFENGIKFDDSTISINWPIEISNISERDKKLPNINSNFKGIII